MDINNLNVLCNWYYFLFQDYNKDNNKDQHAQKNVTDFVDCDDHKDKSMCVKKDCLHNTKTEEIFVSTTNVDDKDFVDDDNIEWVCVYKDCLYHNHIEDINVKDEKSMWNIFRGTYVINTWCETTIVRLLLMFK